MRLNFGTTSRLEIFPYYGQKAPVIKKFVMELLAR
jgi:hypothetical protein